jgi:Sulfatase-modifying factor enzyme 1/PEGA domain
MSQTGKFIPGGGANKNPANTGRAEPIRAPASEETPSRGKRMFTRGAPVAGDLTKQVDPKRKTIITLMSVLVCILLIAISWYYLAVIPSNRHALEVQTQLDARNKEFAEFKKQEEARIAAEALKSAQPAGVKVNSRPTGATVTIGNVIHTTPADFNDLKAGKVTVTIALPGYETTTREITLEGAKNIDLGIIEMVRRMGKLKLTTLLTGVTFNLSGPDGFSRTGLLDANLDGLAEGDYSLIAEHKGWILPAVKLQVKNGEETVTQVSFPYSSISLDSTPSKAVVKSGKMIIGETPLTLKELRPGPLNYTLELPGYKIGHAQFDVTESTDLKKSFSLEKSDDQITSFGMPLVKLTPDYWGGKYEVRQSDYEKVIGSNPSFFRGSNRPVDSVSWNQAKEFCRKATEMEKAAGRLPEGYVFDLPSEIQWEFMLDKSSLENAVTSHDMDLHSTADVGTSEPNDHGLYDMLGNVWEWCLDTFDPSGRTHVMRGGSWLSSRTNFPNSSVRNGAGENYHDKFTGFRVVLTKAPAPLR